MNSRSGAALVIAIVVLAAMLMIGLPFLFTQSSSLSGTRSYAHSRLASMGQDSAQSMGVAAGSSAVSYHWEQVLVEPGKPTTKPIDDWTDLFHGLNGSNPDSGLRRVGVNRIEFDTRNHTFALPGQRDLEGKNPAERDLLLQRYPTVVGLAIEDESGKLNPNFIDMRGWSRLLQQVGITDLPDGRTPQSDPAHQQLARTLGALRYEIPGERITSIDQLLFAEPPLTIPGTTTQVPQQRRSLTRTELERLRPYLTLSVPAQARGGLIDLGTVIGVDSGRITVDHDQPGTLLSFAEAPLLMGINTALVFSDDARGTLTIPAFGETARLPKIGAAAAIDAPPVVNLHHAEPVVRNSFAPSPLPAALAPTPPTNLPQPALLTGLRALPALSPDARNHPLSPFDLLSPVAVVDTVGSTHVLASRLGDSGASGPFDVNGYQVNGATGTTMQLDARATVIHIVTGSLERFPQRGYALIQGKNATGQTDQEIIEYISSSPPLPLSAAAAASRTEVILYVRRGIDGRTGRANGTAKTFLSGTNSQAYDQPNDLHLVALATREQQPLGIASQGVITIASTATVTDPAGNQTAQDQHRVIAQAIPQETALEARWDKQVAFHALLAQRHGSLMASFPRPFLRLTDMVPQDDANVDAMGNRYLPPAFPNDLDASVGVKPAVMRSLVTNPDLNPDLKRDWIVSFSGTGAAALHHRDESANISADGPLGALYTTDDITPEGLALDANRVLAYPNPSNGFLRDRYVPPAPNNPNTGLLAPIDGRQFALWVRPDAQWDKQVALLDMRMPAENVSERLTGESSPLAARDVRTKSGGDAAVSNRFALVYDPNTQQLVLVLNPGSIPHDTDFGPATPRQTFGPTTGIALKDDVWPAVNPESLGRGGVHPMASAPSWALIQHRYHVGDRFTAGEWHLVQVAFSSNQPGGMSIMVDGLVGRDVTRTPGDTTAMTIPGDHLTQPVLMLASDLPTTQQVRDIGSRALYMDRIELQAIAYSSGKLTGAAAVRYLLPERGLVRIGIEYISYQWIDDDGALRDCVRARRQRSHAGIDDQGVPTWSDSYLMEPHRIGDAVYPGGFAFSIPQNVPWHRGGCHLAQPMPDGDRNHKFQVWSKVGVPVLQAVSTTIPLFGGVIAQFPPRGYVLIGNDQLYYDNLGAVGIPELRNVHYDSNAVPVVDADGAPVLGPDGQQLTRAGWQSGLPRAYLSSDDVVLISQEIAGKNAAGVDIDPTQHIRYAQLGTNFVQLYDARDSSAGANAGRAEWISYTEIRSRTDYPKTLGARMSYLINLSLETTDIVPDPDPMQPPTHVKVVRGGFWFTDGHSAPFIRAGARACERTGFAAADFSDYVPTTHTFPALSTRVIPVQTELELAYLLEAGDVVTLAPKVMGGEQRPIQLCVRYSADDGFPEDKTSTTATAWNTQARYFAFTEAIPDEWNPSNAAFHLLSWPCWTPEVDLGVISNPLWSSTRHGWVLPWGNAFAPDFTPNTGSPANRTLNFLMTDATGTTGAVATIDAIHAGEQPGWRQGTQVQANIVPPDNNPWLDDLLLTARLAIRTDQPVFTAAYGLIDIGGEVFAYKADSTQDRMDAERPMNPDLVLNNQAWLIGRALLGSTRRVHRGQELVLHLPIGPVAEIRNTALPIDQLGPVAFDGSFAAPAMLLSSRNGDQMELTTMPNNHTAPWLRGMYNTTPVAWEARPDAATWSNLAPIAIGWWPRYPSAFPQRLTDDVANARVLQKKQKTIPLTNAEQIFLQNHSSLLRCRSYAWAGFPLRFHDGQFSATDSASVQVLSNGDGLFNVQALALDATLDWSAADLLMLLAGNQTPTTTAKDASQVFNSERFRTSVDEVISPRLTNRANTPRSVDGAELRVVWTYSAPMTPSTTSPAEWLQLAARNGNRAPMIGPVYLRTRAPNKVLNVER